MSAFEDWSLALENFSGTARLFPLPNLVLFPHVLQPLHIFEPRYRDLLEDSLQSDRLIAMAILAPGWESDYEGRPPVYPVACLARVTTYHRLEDGTYNVLLLGLQRVRLVRELQPVRTFREARVELCEDYLPAQMSTQRGELRRRLRAAVRRVLPMLPEVQEQLDQLLGAETALGVLTDIVSYVLDMDLPEKKVLLAQVDVCHRAELLLKHLSVAAGARRPRTCCAPTFPPQFSAN